MIKINLALRKTSASVMAETAKPSFLSGLFGKMGGGESASSPTVHIRDIASILGSVALGFFLMYQLDEIKSGELASLQTEVDGLRSEQAKLKAETQKITSYEELRKQVEADEKLIRNKLDTIRKLMTNRNLPARLLLSLSQSLPPEVWIREMNVTEKNAILQGSAVGFNQVSDLMRILNDGIFLKNVELKGTEEAKVEGFEVKNFELMAEKE